MYSGRAHLDHALHFHSLDARRLFARHNRNYPVNFARRAAHRLMVKKSILNLQFNSFF